MAIYDALGQTFTIRMGDRLGVFMLTAVTWSHGPFEADELEMRARLVRELPLEQVESGPREIGESS